MSRPGATNETLTRRSELLRRLREFFYAREFVEVETPLLSREIIPEQHIEPVRVATQHSENFLQASPELHMKRLVAAGMPAIFQVTRSFRDDELGVLHNPEFTIVEWYRIGDDMLAGMQLLDELCQAMLGAPTARMTTYAEAFQQHVELCPHTATLQDLSSRAQQLNIKVADNFRCDDRDEWLNLLLSFCVEPKLGNTEPEILYAYPATQVALANRTKRDDGIDIAERFELYFQGIELANGYHELTNAVELRDRLETVNEKRTADGRDSLPMPESLLAAMEAGLPACAGCALGFDRLVMLASESGSIADVMAFPKANDGKTD